MHDHRINADRLEKDDVSRDPLALCRIGRVHEAAAVFHDEDLPPTPLNVGQRLQQRSGFADQLIHNAQLSFRAKSRNLRGCSAILFEDVSTALDMTLTT